MDKILDQDKTHREHIPDLIRLAKEDWAASSRIYYYSARLEGRVDNLYKPGHNPDLEVNRSDMQQLRKYRDKHNDCVTAIKDILSPVMEPRVVTVVMERFDIAMNEEFASHSQGR